jgi:hypothetical protein
LSLANGTVRDILPASLIFVYIGQSKCCPKINKFPSTEGNFMYHRLAPKESNINEYQMRRQYLYFEYKLLNCYQTSFFDLDEN